MSTTMTPNHSTDSELHDTRGHHTAPAGLIRRGLGYFFDTCLFAIVILFAQRGINQVVTDKTAQYWITLAAASILFFLYRFLMDAHANGTLGKATVGIKVTTETGGRLGYAWAWKRNFYWLAFGPTLAPAYNYPQFQLSVGSVGPETLIYIWIIALMISIYRDRNNRSFLDHWAGAYFN